MHKSKAVKPALGLLLLAVCVAPAGGTPLQGGDFSVTRSVIAGGGGAAAGGQFSLTGTIGQAEAQPQAATGGGFTLAGGFWARASDLIFSDSFESD